MIISFLDFRSFQVYSSDAFIQNHLQLNQADPGLQGATEAGRGEVSRSRMISGQTSGWGESNTEPFTIKRAISGPSDQIKCNRSHKAY